MSDNFFSERKYLSEKGTYYNDIIGQECPYCGKEIDKDPIIWHMFSSGINYHFVRLSKYELRPDPRFNNAPTHYIPKGTRIAGRILCPHCDEKIEILEKKDQYACPQCHRRIDYDKWEHNGDFFKATLQDICPKCGWHSAPYGIKPKPSKKKKPKVSDYEFEVLMEENELLVEENEWLRKQIEELKQKYEGGNNG